MSARPIQIAPSILAADFARLGEQVTTVAAAGADVIHVDVMDGHFVPNITIGPLVVSALSRIVSVPLDVHLMITDPDRYLDAFVKAGAGIISVHVEATVHLDRTLTRIRELGARAGVAINPGTPLSALSEVLDLVDQVIVMSVNPGFGGQSFIPRSVTRVAELRALLADRPVDIEVDGGVDSGNARTLVQAGATMLVAGASIFGRPDPAAATVALRQAATS
ncbi:MAG: ribulose-phosphate 3-epimerase [Acidobacteria bacterium]|nr:ribulose-phosphate 3-epimerase [Acidobacteriota bacterium]